MNFREYYLREIGDRIIEPSNVDLKIRYGVGKEPVFHYTFVLTLNDIERRYYVQIDPFEYTDMPEVGLSVDFGIYDESLEHPYTTDLTGDHEPLTVLSNVVGIVKRCLRLDLLKEFDDSYIKDKLYLSMIRFSAVKEDIEDKRREKLYERVIKTQLKQLNIEIRDIIKIGSAAEQEEVGFTIKPIKIKDIK